MADGESEGEWNMAEVGELRVNKYIMIDDEPCQIISIDTSKPGKHGEAKSRIEALGVFTGSRKSIVHPVKHKVKIPMIDKHRAQVLTLLGEDTAQLMDVESFETFEIPIPADLKEFVAAGKEVLYFSSMGRRKIVSKA